MKIKQIPEDFIVEEVLPLKIEHGNYHYYLLEKKNWNTLDIIAELKKRLNTDIGYAGIKDRNAITKQYISVARKKINFIIKDVSFKHLGTGKERIFLGAHEGNKFTITLRDLDKKMSPPKEIINFFGEQRFSSKNVMLGKLLITKKFKEACAELNLSAERNDFVGALKSLGREKLKLYLHAYQSELWNRLAKKSKKKVLHIIGFLTEGKDYDNILKEEGITKENFILRAIPELSSEGTERKRIIPIKNFKTISFEDDELNPGKKKQVISFYLQKGAYATTLIEQLK